MSGEHAFTECASTGTHLIESNCGHFSAKYEVTGGLADRVRARLGKAAGEPVYLYDTAYESGYSEFTLTSDWSEFVIECGDESVTFFNSSGKDAYSGNPYRSSESDGWLATQPSYCDENPIVKLIEWLEDQSDTQRRIERRST